MSDNKLTFWSRLRTRASKLVNGPHPSPRAWRGGTVVLALTALAIWLWATLPQFIQPLPLPSLLIVGLDLVVAFVVGALLALFLKRLATLPGLFFWVLLSALVLLVALGAGPSQRGWFLSIAVLLVAGSLIGGTVWSMLRGWKQLNRARRIQDVFALIIALVVLIGGATWLFAPGSPAPAIPYALGVTAPTVTPNEADPSQPGTFTVRTLTYGSGTDLRRPEYGADVTIRTESVDGTPFLQGWQGWSGGVRTSFWGFDTRSLPLNGRVWYPEGAGPFPLVLIVHGNSRAEDFSDGGFAYLGELLASRGFIAASIDENFLNTGLIDTLGGLSGANATRGWLLLEHLRAWHAWNEQADNPFYGRIDTANIALVGHSRGGEAIATAAAFNRMQRFPDDATIQFRYNYAIRSLVAIAPSDGQYLPANEPIQLENINYLTLQGTHDADIGTFAGLNQYHRVGLTDDGDWFKAALYIYRANHSQFNTTWDRYDLGDGLSTRFIDTAALLPADEQRRIAQVAVSAFLESTLRDSLDYEDFFRDIRVGQAWLPDTVYKSQYANATTQRISTFEEDVDVTTATIRGGSQTGEGLEVWREEFPVVRLGTSQNRVARLGWQRAEGAAAPRYTIALPEQGITTTGSLRFDLADVTVGQAGGDPAALTDLTVEVRDADGTTARLPLSHFAPLQPLMEGQYLKSAFLHDRPLSEPVMQTYTFPLADFAAADDAFDPATLAAISFVFDTTPAGTVLLDDVGIASDD